MSQRHEFDFYVGDRVGIYPSEHVAGGVGVIDMLLLYRDGTVEYNVIVEGKRHEDGIDDRIWYTENELFALEH